MAAAVRNHLPFMQDIWTKDENLPRAHLMSLAMHFVIAAALFLSAFLVGAPPGLRYRGTILDYRIYPGEPPKSIVAKTPARGGGSGGEENPVPATKGKLPPFAWLQISPPMPPRNPNPHHTEPATLVGPPNMPLPESALKNFGLPKAADLTDSAGPGHRGGFGNQCCGGVGSEGDGRGYDRGEKWGTGGPGVPKAGTVGTTFPECLYCPNPTFTDEARKIKMQGTVALRVIVTPDGRASRIEVVKGLGYGLDERAVEAVRGWRFRPSRDAAGKPVATWLTVEVTFRLL